MSRKVFLLLVIAAAVSVLLINQFSSPVALRSQKPLRFIEEMNTTASTITQSGQVTPPSQHLSEQAVPRLPKKGKKILPAQIISGITHFVLFIGCDRSGSSILGSLMDAHPHAIIANECHFQVPIGKTSLFNRLYSASAKNKKRHRSDKGYTLYIDGLWQGTYDSHIEVIGDKTSGLGVIPFISSEELFRSKYKMLKADLNIPIHAIQAVRNPYDVISTGAIIKTRGREYFRKKKLEVKQTAKFAADKRIREEIQFVFDMYASAQYVKDIMGKENVLDIHNMDLINDPRGTISRIFKFIGVETTEHYLDVCALKVFGSESQSRHLVQWTPELIKLVERQMKKYEELNRYNFTSP